MDYQGLTAEFLRNISSISQIINHSKGKNASSGRAFVLQYLRKRDEAFSSDICSEMNVTTARMASILNSLEEKGLIMRRIDAKDRRKIVVSITEDGKKQAAENEKWVMQKMQQTLEQLGAEDALAFVRITGKLVDIFSQHPLP